jgi:hypothetical protein
MITTENMSAAQCVPPIQRSQAYQEDEAKWAEEERLRKELEADIRRVWGDPPNMEGELRAHEKKSTAQEEIATRIGESILSPANNEIWLKKQKQKMELWIKVIEDWREEIERGKRGLRLLRAIIMCRKRRDKLWIKLRGELREEKKNIEQHRKSRIKLVRNATELDKVFLESERRLMECEENFREWDLKKLLEWEEESLESHDKEEWEDERRAIKGEREAMAAERRAVEVEKRPVEDKRRAMEDERRAIKREREAMEERRAVEEEWKAMEKESRAVEEEWMRMTKEGIWKRLLKRSEFVG